MNSPNMEILRPSIDHDLVEAGVTQHEWKSAGEILNSQSALIRLNDQRVRTNNAGKIYCYKTAQNSWVPELRYGDAPQLAIQRHRDAGAEGTIMRLTDHSVGRAFCLNKRGEPSLMVVRVAPVISTMPARR